MTKVQLNYRLLRPLDETLMRRIASAHGIYGIQRVQMAQQMDRLVVDYDASRLTPEQVDAALHRGGLPVERA